MYIFQWFTRLNRDCVINCAMPKLHGLELFFITYLKVRLSYGLNFSLRDSLRLRRSQRCCRRTWSRRILLIKFDVRSSNQVSPACAFGGNIGSKSTWRHRSGFSAYLCEPIRNAFIIHAQSDCIIKLFDNISG